MPIFGYNGSINVTAGIDVDELFGSDFTLPENATISKITFKGRRLTVNTFVKAVICRVSDLAIVAVSNPKLINSGTTQDWEVGFSINPELPAGDYFLGIVPQTSFFNLSATNTVPNATRDYSNSYATPISPSDRVAVNPNRQFHIYATYEAGYSSTTTPEPTTTTPQQTSTTTGDPTTTTTGGPTTTTIEPFREDDLVLFWEATTTTTTTSVEPYRVDDIVLEWDVTSTTTAGPTTTTTPPPTTTTVGPTTTTDPSGWTITLTDVSNRKVVQRNASNEGTLSIAGSYSGTALSIQARLVDHGTTDEVVGWTTIDDSPSGGAFSGTLTGIPQGGWYNVQVRFGNSTGVTDEGSNRFGVGIIVACIGQSNMDRFFSNYTDLTANDLLSVYDGSWGQPTNNGAVAFGNYLITNLSTPVPVALLDYAIGSTALLSEVGALNGYWLDETSSEPYDLFLTGVSEVGGTIEFLLWYQGEADAGVDGVEVTETEYEAGLATFFQNLRDDITWRNNTVQIIGYMLADAVLGEDRNYPAVRKAQFDRFAIESDVYPVTTNDLGLQDTAHLDASGYTSAGQRGAQACLYLLGEESYFRGPEVSHFVQVDSTKVDIYLTHRGGNDFTPTSSITGFTASDGGGAKTISSAVRQSASAIRLTFSSPISGSLEINYMTTTELETTGAVIDNSSLGLPLEYSSQVGEQTTTTPAPTTPTTSTTSEPTTTLEPYRVDDIVLEWSITSTTTTTLGPTTTTTPEPTTTTAGPTTTTDMWTFKQKEESAWTFKDNIYQ